MGYNNVKRVFVLPKTLVSPTIRLVLLSLAERADDTTCEAWPGNGDFVRRTSLNRATVWRALSQLEAQGLVSITPPHIGANAHSSNLYRLNWDIIDQQVLDGLPIGGPSGRRGRLVDEDDQSPSATSTSRLARPGGRPVRRGVVWCNQVVAGDDPNQ